MTTYYIRFGENPKQNKNMLTRFIKKYSRNITKDLVFIKSLRDDLWCLENEYASIDNTEYRAEFWFAEEDDYDWDREDFEDVTKECLSNDLGVM